MLLRLICELIDNREEYLVVLNDCHNGSYDVHRYEKKQNKDGESTLPRIENLLEKNVDTHQNKYLVLCTNAKKRLAYRLILVAF